MGCGRQRRSLAALQLCTLSTSTDTDKAIKANSNLGAILKPILPVFISKQANKLKTACAWVLRAHLSSRSLDRVLEAAITMEVLLGDRDTSDRVGLSKLMANRCAYALGKSASERDHIIDLFSRFYKLRSEIVHSGRTNLDVDERKVVNRGLDLATKTLKHEIEIAS